MLRPPSSTLPVLLLCLSALTACDSESATWASEAQPRSVGSDASQTARSSKSEICHTTDGAADWLLLEVSDSAVDAHMAHGDQDPFTVYLDADGDGEGDGDTALDSQCTVPAGYVSNADDCDDLNDAVSTTADEVCGDGIDNNCDGQVDEDCATTTGCPCADEWEVLYDGSGGLIDGITQVADFIPLVGNYRNVEGSCWDTPQDDPGRTLDRRQYEYWSSGASEDDFLFIAYRLDDGGGESGEGTPQCFFDAFDDGDANWWVRSSGSITEAQLESCQDVVDELIATQECLVTR